MLTLEPLAPVSAPFSQIACRATRNEVVRVVASASANGNGMVDMLEHASAVDAFQPARRHPGIDVFNGWWGNRVHTLPGAARPNHVARVCSVGRLPTVVVPTDGFLVLSPVHGHVGVHTLAIFVLPLRGVLLIALLAVGEVTVLPVLIFVEIGKRLCRLASRAGVRFHGVSITKEKYNRAALDGWRVLRFFTDQVKDGTAVATIKEALA